MEKKLFLGGIGGQGVVYGGKLLGAAAVAHGRFATIYTSHSTAMRNGFSYSTVIVSPEPVLAPVTTFYDCMAFFDEDSCEKQSHLLDEGGVYVLHSPPVHKPPAKAEAAAVWVDAGRLANRLGGSRMLNLVMIGAVIGASGLMDPAWIKEQIRGTFAHRPDMAEANIGAFEAGYHAAVEQMGRS